MYVKAPASLIYHLLLIDGLTVCMESVEGAHTPARRGSDWKVMSEKPSGQFNVLCRECERRSSPDYVKPKPVPLTWREICRHVVP
jgi:hypothetical protein